MDDAGRNHAFKLVPVRANAPPENPPDDYGCDNIILWIVVDVIAHALQSRGVTIAATRTG